MRVIKFAWNHEQTEGTTYQLYEKGALVIDKIGNLHFDLLMPDKPFGSYTYTVKAVNKLGILSVDSNAVTVNFTQPVAPTNLRYTVA